MGDSTVRSSSKNILKDSDLVFIKNPLIDAPTTISSSTSSIISQDNYSINLHQKIDFFLNKIKTPEITSTPDILKKLVEIFPSVAFPVDDLSFLGQIKDLQLRILKKGKSISNKDKADFEVETAALFKRTSEPTLTNLERENYPNVINSIDTYLDHMHKEPLSSIYLFFEGKYDKPNDIFQLLSQLIYIHEGQLQDDRHKLTSQEIQQQLPFLIKKFEELYANIENSEEIKVWFLLASILILKITHKVNFTGNFKLLESYQQRLRTEIASSTRTNCFTTNQTCKVFVETIEKELK
jgi:hypothetical protein